ncbi:hypothetical protein DSECCO2_574610 [anaerobic digester metagenome]
MGVLPRIVETPEGLQAFHGSLRILSEPIGDGEILQLVLEVKRLNGRFEVSREQRSRPLAAQQMGRAARTSPKLFDRGKTSEE